MIQNKLVVAWQPHGSPEPWLPTEFLLAQYITRILITGRASAVSSVLSADQSWTQVWRSPGNKEWSCVVSVLQHMPGPVLVVVGPDLILTPKLVQTLQAAARSGHATIVVMRQVGAAAWAGEPADQVFFPVMDARATTSGLMAVVNEWAPRTAPRGLDIKTLIPQLAAQGYGLTVSDGVWQWYRPADSTGLATLSVSQIARQLQILGAVLEKAVI